MAAENDRGRGDDRMDRATFRAPGVLLDGLEEYAQDAGYGAQSEAFRAALRDFVPDEYLPIRERRRVQPRGEGSD